MLLNILGAKFMSLDMGLDMDKFHRVLKSQITKPEYGVPDPSPYVWIQYADHNKQVFEKVASLLHTFSEHHKSLFCSKGVIVVRGTKMECLIYKNDQVTTRKSQYLDLEYDYE